MKNTTLCYLEQNGCYLMLHRVKKKQDENAGKWIGIGGKLEENESPEECCCREFLEETGLTLTDYRYRGVITFVSDQWEGEYMHLFSATAAAHICDAPFCKSRAHSADISPSSPKAARASESRERV